MGCKVRVGRGATVVHEEGNPNETGRTGAEETQWPLAHRNSETTERVRFTLGKLHTQREGWISHPKSSPVRKGTQSIRGVLRHKSTKSHQLLVVPGQL